MFEGTVFLSILRAPQKCIDESTFWTDDTPKLSNREAEKGSERVRGFPESAGAADGRRHRLGPGRRLRRTKGIALMAVVVAVVVEVERGGGLLGVVELHGDDQWMQWRQVAIERSIRRQIHGRQKPRDEIGGRRPPGLATDRPFVRPSDGRDGWMDAYGAISLPLPINTIAAFLSSIRYPERITLTSELTVHRALTMTTDHGEKEWL